MAFNLTTITRKNIQNLKPYASARDEYTGSEGIFLDANENSFGSATKERYNRYPDPLQKAVKTEIAKIKGVSIDQILLGNGSDEPIDLLYRCFCNPGIDAVLLTPPTYGMYEVSAHINDISIIKVPLDITFQLRVEAILDAITEQTKLIFICSPNNPTGNALRKSDIQNILNNFNGIVVVDEAYIDFAPEYSMLPDLKKYPNLVILQTFSKAWGMANLRLGMAFASETIIALFNKVKPPYNISGVAQQLALEGLQNIETKNNFVSQILKARSELLEMLHECSCVTHIYPTDSNMVLVKTTNGTAIYDYLINAKIITRNRSNVILCEDCIRITVGTPFENKALIEALKAYPF